MVQEMLLRNNTAKFIYWQECLIENTLLLKKSVYFYIMYFSAKFPDFYMHELSRDNKPENRYFVITIIVIYCGYFILQMPEDFKGWFILKDSNSWNSLCLFYI